MARKLAVIAVLMAAIGGLLFWFLTAPQSLGAMELAVLPAGDAARGESIFRAGGCTSCHARPKAEGDAELELAGGRRLVTAFGTFLAPNISSDPEHGIGAWSAADFANAMLRGVAPDGRHYYPAFPYTSYARMTEQDVADLFAFMRSLPAVGEPARGHELTFPFTIRRGLGLWKRLHLRREPVVALDDSAGDAVKRGRYLVEGPGHCGECHTPRDFSGGLDYARWLAGAKAVEGDGKIPNITPGGGGVGSWSAADIAYYLESGFTPDFDSVGGAMVEVQENMAKLSAADREAIAAYLKAVPEQPRGANGG